MTMQHIQVHPDNPQPRLIALAVKTLREGGVIAYPTDSAYALGCHIGDVDAVRRLRALRGLDEKHLLTLVCADLSQIANYARVDNTAFRILKRATPGPFTFILQATREVPKRLQTPKRNEIGLRVPAHAVAHALLAELGEPILSATFIPHGETEPMHEPDEITERKWNGLDLLVDSGACPNDATTIIRLDESGEAEIIRQGAGDARAIGL
jgi:tRNA threonylcarbamoyl adenosine modification protein (Sua5/YciO/YrdC/YwlC family)